MTDPSKKTQTGKILAHMQSGRRIDQMSALNCYGCFRLAARVNDLIHQGYNISGEIVKVPTRDGGSARVKSYWLVEE